MESASAADGNKLMDSNLKLEQTSVKEPDSVVNSDLRVVELTSKTGVELEQVSNVNKTCVPSEAIEQSESNSLETGLGTSKDVATVLRRENNISENAAIGVDSEEKKISNDVGSSVPMQEDNAEVSILTKSSDKSEKIVKIADSSDRHALDQEIAIPQEQTTRDKVVSPVGTDLSKNSTDISAIEAESNSHARTEADDSLTTKSNSELRDVVSVEKTVSATDDSVKTLDIDRLTNKQSEVNKVDENVSDDISTRNTVDLGELPGNHVDSKLSDECKGVDDEIKVVDQESKSVDSESKSIDKSSINKSEKEEIHFGGQPAEASVAVELSEDNKKTESQKADNWTKKVSEKETIHPEKIVIALVVEKNLIDKPAEDVTASEKNKNGTQEDKAVEDVTTSEKNKMITQEGEAVDVSKSKNDGQSSTSEVETLNKIEDKSCEPVGEDSVMNEDDSLKSNLLEEEPSLNFSEAGDEDQEMQEFLHVSSKDKDLEDPMSVDAGEEMMEVSNPTDEDPIGLLDEPDHPKIVDTQEEPMDIDDTSDKSEEVPDNSGKTSMDAELDIEDKDTLALDQSATDVAETSDVQDPEATDESTAQNAESVDDAVGTTDDATADSAVETTDSAVGTADSTGETADSTIGTSDASTAESTIADASDVLTAVDEAPAEDASAAPDVVADDDEEVCIIPDTFRVPLATDGAAKEKAGEAAIDESKKDVSVAEAEKSDTIKVVDKVITEKGKTGKAVIIEAKPSGRPQRLAAKKAESQIKELAKGDSSKDDSNSGDATVVPNRHRPDEIRPIEPIPQTCFQCNRLTNVKYQTFVDGYVKYLCEESCTKLYRKGRDSLVAPKVVVRTPQDFTRKCGQCSAHIVGDEKNLSWETMDFCNEECLGKYMTLLGSFCANCKGPVASSSLGKYCVRFGYDIKQFCVSSCLEEFKKGLKVCSYCQKDISNDTDGFLAPVGDKGQFKDFCTQKCMAQYDHMGNNQPPPTEMHECDVCNNEKVVQVEVLLGPKLHKLCSDPCFAAFKFVNKVDADQCEMCKKYFDKMKTEMFSVFYEEAAHNFCSKTCMNVYILANRKIVPCHWCKVKKYNFDMIKRVTNAGQVIMMCSLNCLTLYQVSVSAVSSKKILCDYCKKTNQAQYHLTMSDATIRNFCAYTCVMAFQNQYSKTPPLTLPPGTEKPVIPTGGPKRNTSNTRRSITVAQNENQSMPTQTNSLPVISSVQSLAPNGQQVTQANARAQALKTNNINVQTVKPPQVVYKQQVIVKPPVPVEVHNKGVSCKPIMLSKGTSIRPTQGNKETQTDDSIGRPIFIPVPVPIYVPAPMHMYSIPFPMPVPFPLPIPVPMFIPTTRNSISGILKEIKRIQEKIPTDPFEAELLMMAEMVAGEKKAENSDSDSDDGDNGAGDVSEAPEATSAVEGEFSPEAVDTSNFGEDMLQMALKMASELEEPAVDLEAALTPSTITAQSNTSMEQTDVTESEVDDPEPVLSSAERSNRGRKRGLPAPRRGSLGSPSKRGRRVSSSGGGGDASHLPPPEPPAAPRVEVEKPDANMCLKYTFGVNAWRQWVNVKNSELEKASNNRKLKLFKPEILQLTSDELNYSLCLFVKEVRKPNGSEYAPDTIYYLVLGIQQYLFENGRIDNIFTDAYYEKFTECLDEVAKKFSLLFNEQQYIVTRVEEEHLWESKQLGAHSPHVLLSTLMFFNTKHFNLTTVEEHMQLSFSHIMKHWKRNPNQPGATKVPGSRNVLLRFYPPQASLEANSRKKKVYEQQENEENPIRCPVKLYEFYLSKCPESVKTRNDVFYLLPERSCVPDSPVWYSTMALGRDPLVKMLHRVKMVKEINMALFTS